MEISKQILKVERMARVYRMDNPERTPKVLIIALHGYGQLAYYFIQHFKSLIQTFPVRVVAPEGLSRFYLDDHYHRVGASWMTREDRLFEIEDQLQYLNKVLDLEIKSFVNKLPSIHILGFSQGTATAWRWVSGTDLPIERLILWAGMIPKEPFVKTSSPLIVPVLGTQDPYFSGERRTEYLNILEELQLVDELITFDGEHRIDLPVLHQLYWSYFNPPGSYIAG